jgi:sedoheptulokinase
MYSLGIDIGTTSIAAVVVNMDDGAVAGSHAEPNGARVAGESWESLQDPGLILSKAEEIVRRLTAAHPGVRCVGLAGQMHGILYADASGMAVSPLYTWQDGRGNLTRRGGLTYAESLSAETGKNLATGYGAVTHVYNMENGLVPDGAKWAVTIQDYVGMRLAGLCEPLVHATDAASFGASDLYPFSSMLRITDKTECVGHTGGGIPVAVAIGDNQASFIGSVGIPDDSVLINMGTGGQISVAADGATRCEGAETRPYIDGGSLLVGFSLCGGRAYAMLERFFRDTAEMAGIRCGSLYDKMNALAAPLLEDPLSVSTLFCGTRADPSLKGSISGIGDSNLTPAHLVQGVLRGMAGELYVPYPAMRALMRKKPVTLVGSGNGIRKNKPLRKLFESMFGMQMKIPAHNEEAAYGAALFAAAACGMRASVAEAQRVIRYCEA